MAFLISYYSSLLIGIFTVCNKVLINNVYLDTTPVSSLVHCINKPVKFFNLRKTNMQVAPYLFSKLRASKKFKSGEILMGGVRQAAVHSCVNQYYYASRNRKNQISAEEIN